MELCEWESLTVEVTVVSAYVCARIVTMDGSFNPMNRSPFLADGLLWRLI